MKTSLLLFLSFLTFTGYTQIAFHNYGNAQIHNNGKIGFHTDVINDGRFDNNVGFAGFYSEDRLTVSGTSKPVFHNVEVNVENDLYLEVSVGMNNFQEFVNGRVITPRDQKQVSFDYIDDAPYLGESDIRYVDGYATLTGLLDFSFPVGDDFRHRPIRIESNASTNTSRAAYFFENPNIPNFFSEGFDTSNFGDLLYGISIFEFWDLDGNETTRVTLTWDDNSNIPTLVDNLSDLRVVGWHKELKRWVNLGNTDFTGDLDRGEITSDPILPDDYEILTFGSSNRILDGDLEIFTAVSPNGDDKNDFFFIQGLSRFPENSVSIYNRWGVQVYEKEQYHLVQTTNGFAGVSEGRATLNQSSELPVGTYYYVLKIKGQKDRAGYLYINR